MKEVLTVVEEPALWAGGLVSIIMAMPTVFTANGRSASLTAMLIRRFSPIGIFGVSLVVSTGLFLTSVHVVEPRGLSNFIYGNLIVAKTIGVAAAVALAGVHKFVTQKHMHTDNDVARFRRTLRIETAIVIVVFMLAAALTSTSPPGHPMDASGQMIMKTKTTFQSLLTRGAIAIGVAGLLMLAQEWRQRSTNRS